LRQEDMGGGDAILIVEDEALIRYDLADFFEDHGFRVFDAESADRAIAVLERHSEVRIVLTDVQMPGSMDGIRLAHHIRDRYPPTLLIVASGAIRPTANDLPPGALFFPKPFDPRTVLRAIRQAS
jgi:DNA-binding NtrC family response regulator